MCGISGIYNLNHQTVDHSLIRKINNTLVHRGPDSGDIYVFDNVALGHRRLSIIDLSESANQPMFSEDKRYSIVFNGEVYNFQEIKVELQKEGFDFFTHSDTEVVLKSFIHWGTECFPKFNGMFALAILDTHTKIMVLARDQFGIKPLNYYWDKSHFIFASEKKAILAHPGANTSLNNQALIEYLWYGNPLGNNTFFNEIKELSPGSYLQISKGKVSIKPYYSINSSKEININEAEAVEEIKRLFEASIRRHLISDVPVGVFLSGGIDSSAITAFASKNYDKIIKSYSVGFDFAKGPNELDKAAQVAKKYNTEHKEVFISGSNTIDTIEALIYAHDEPFGDAADIPLYLLTKELKGTVKVVLQGDGGDEFFGGYSRYNTIGQINKYKWAKSFLPLISISGIENTRLLQVQRFISAISEKSPSLRNAFLLTMESKYTKPLRVLNGEYLNRVKDLNPFQRYKDIYESFPIGIDNTQAIFYADTQIILKDTFFEKVDKSTMANSIEVRVPFIDKDLTEFMLSVPAHLKVKNGVQKYLLKKALEGIVPNDILYGKKTGFSVPYGYWLKTALYDYFKDQIHTKRVTDVLNISEVKKMHNLHHGGKGNFGFLLWKTLILAIWLNKIEAVV